MLCFIFLIIELLNRTRRKSMRKNYGYCRVSTYKQDASKQKDTLLNYGYENNITFEEIIEVVISSRKSTKEREIDKLINIADSGDKIFITKLDRLARNTRETLETIDILKNKNITLHIIKENIIIDPSNTDPISTMFLTLLSSFNQLEIDFIRARTVEGLIRAKEQGKMLGKPKGSISKHTQFENDKEKIYEFLKIGLSYQKIINNLGYGSKSALFSFVKHRRTL